VANIEPFEQFTDEYDAWFDHHQREYDLELRALAEVMPSDAVTLEVGVGTGKFAVPLGVQYGLDPSEAMSKKAGALGVEVTKGVAEDLPYSDASFDCILMVTTICFVDDLEKSFDEASRVLRAGGAIVIGFVDRESNLGQQYLAKQDKSRFYGIAHFYSTQEVLELLRKTGFGQFKIRQTLLPKGVDQEVIDGHGQGSFIAIRAIKQN
jgi:ubiquinone/menaquinone biosynthesis C-methylase UbiE